MTRHRRAPGGANVDGLQAVAPHPPGQVAHEGARRVANRGGAHRALQHGGEEGAEELVRDGPQLLFALLRFLCRPGRWSTRLKLQRPPEGSAQVDGNVAKIDVFYTELQTRYRRVRLFLPTLLHQVHFEAAPAGAAVVAALEYLKRREAPARAQDVAPSAVVTTAWRRYVYGANDAVDHRAYTFCVLDQLREALRRRDVFVTPSWRYADPRRNLLAGAEWEAARADHVSERLATVLAQNRSLPR